MCVEGSEGGPIWSTLLSLLLPCFPAVAGGLQACFSCVPLFTSPPPRPSCFPSSWACRGKKRSSSIPSRVLGYNGGFWSCEW